ncbi:hypothetical protein QUB19_26495 [Microcoleus sp. B4-C5]|uniref:hypothetical protein n=1 Tax=unclassified Microcoleus TaxID=2642155 RepID=UPI002FD30733
MPVPQENIGVADLRYERLKIQVIETGIHKASGFSTYFFHTLIKQHRKSTLCGTGILPVLENSARCEVNRI